MSGIDDVYTKSLLHFNGTNGSTTFTDESGKTWAAGGNAQISTATSVFGGASVLFDGTGDYISTADNGDWWLDDGSNSNQWTIDFRLYLTIDNAFNPIVSHYQDVNNYWTISSSDTANSLTFSSVVSGSASIVVSNAFVPTSATWYHVAVVKNGTEGYKFFINGTQIGTTATSANSLTNFTGSLLIGAAISGGSMNFLNGRIDEFRLSKGVARWTSNFSPPGIEYQPYVSTGMMSFLF
jgi:hypothetical protein